MATTKADQELQSRVSFYGKIGEYFQPDGSIDRESFLSSLKRSLGEIRNQNREEAAFARAGAEWLSQYINEILAYLREKGMVEAAFTLFRTAIAQAKASRLDSIAVSPAFLEDIIAEQPAKEKTKRKNPSRDAKRTAIFKASLKVFERDGYPKSTMDAIAVSARLGKASIYRIFKNKEAILDELLGEQYYEIVFEINKILSKDSDVLGQIKEMVSFWLSYIAQNYTVYHLILTEKNSAGTSNRVQFYDYLMKNLPMFKERIVALNRENKLKTLNFYSAFYGILGYIDGIVIKWLRDGKSYDLKEQVPGILDVIFTGIVTPGDIAHSARN